MSQCLFGVETEYAVAMLDQDRSAVEHTAADLVGLAPQLMATLPDGGAYGYFLENGGRLYMDCGKPEYSTPECTHPDDLVRHVGAGHRIVARLAGACVGRFPDVHEALVLRSNVDYSGNGATWGCHESYLHRGEPRLFPQQLIPHLASRIVYSGAGGFDNLRPRELRFTLSPRALHTVREISDNSTGGRGIFHTKHESLSQAGYHRLHVICGESLCSQLALWLKIGTTALVVALIDAGLQPGEGVRLPQPVTALQRFALDPSCRSTVVCADGVRRSAIDIQRHYLEAVESNLGAGFLPPWAAAVCERWRAVLDRLDQGPEAVAAELDWAMKLAVYGDHLRRGGFDWELVGRCNQVMAEIAPPLPATGILPDLLADPTPPPAAQRAAATAEELAARHGLRDGELARFGEQRDRLFTLDARFGELGDEGIFGALDAKGVLLHRVVGEVEIERAVAHPPPGGRARVRGKQVRRLHRHGDRYVAGWSQIVDNGADRYLDLGDPFARLAEWRSIDELTPHFVFPGHRDFTLETARRAAIRRLRGARYRQGMQAIDCALLFVGDRAEMLHLRLLQATARHRLGQRRRARSLMTTLRRRAAAADDGPTYLAAAAHQIAADVSAARPRDELLQAVGELERHPWVAASARRAAPLQLLRARVELASGNFATARELVGEAMIGATEQEGCFDLEAYLTTRIECGVAMDQPECPLAGTRESGSRLRLLTICEAACAAQQRHGGDRVRAIEHARNALRGIELNENEEERLFVARIAIATLLDLGDVADAEAALERFASLRGSEIAEHRYHMEMLYGDVHLRRAARLGATEAHGRGTATPRRRSAALWYADRARSHYHRAARLATRLDAAFATTWRGDRARRRLARQQAERRAVR